VTTVPGVSVTNILNGLPLTGLVFNGVAGQNVTTCQQVNVGVTGGSVPNVTASTTNSFLAVALTEPQNNQNFNSYLNNVEVFNTNNTNSVSANGNPYPVPVTICANAGGVPAQTTRLNGIVTVQGSGVGAPAIIPVTYVLTGGKGSPANLQQISVFRPPATVANPAGTLLGQFSLDDSGTYNYAGATTKMYYFGLNGDQPVAGDFFNTGVVEYGVFRNGNWYIDKNNNGVWDGVAGGDVIWSFGLPNSATTTDQAFVGDWTGDGTSKLGILRCPVAANSLCTVYLDAGNKHAYDPATVVIVQGFGLTGDIPVANNWNHTGSQDQIGTFRCPVAPATGVCTWYVDTLGNGTVGAMYQYGLPTDRPIVGNWFGTGNKRIGVFRTLNGFGQVVLNLSGSNSYPLGGDFTGSFGLVGDLPVIGLWTQFP